MMQLAQALDLSRARPFDGEPGGKTFEGARDRVIVFDLFPAGLAHDHFIVRPKGDIAFDLEGPQRLAQADGPTFSEAASCASASGSPGTSLPLTIASFSFSISSLVSDLKRFSARLAPRSRINEYLPNGFACSCQLSVCAAKGG